MVKTVQFLPHTVYRLSADVTLLPRCTMGNVHCSSRM